MLTNHLPSPPVGSPWIGRKRLFSTGKLRMMSIGTPEVPAVATGPPLCHLLARTTRRDKKTVHDDASLRCRAVRFAVSDSASGTSSAAITSWPPSISGHLATTDSGQALGGPPEPWPPLWLRPPRSRDVWIPSTLSILQRKILTTSVRIRSSTTPPVTTRVGGNFRNPTCRRKPVTIFSKPQRGRPIKSASVLTS